MANLRDIRKRIRSVQSTKKITKAMKMVAAAKLRRAQEAAEQSKPYAKAINGLLANLVSQGVGAGHPLLTARPVQKRLLVIFSSDRGLCGAFNSGLFRKVEKELQESAIPTELLLIGRKAQVYFSRRAYTIYKKQDSFWAKFSHQACSELATELLKAYTEGTFDRIDLMYNEFLSVITQRPILTTFVPVTTEAKPELKIEEAQNTAEVPPVFEPTKEFILNALVPKAVEVRFYQPCLQSMASEFGARMSAMDSATRNAGDMIDSLTLTMNRVRQANITRELVEIISGAEAVN